MPDPEPAHIPTSNYVIDRADGVVTDTVTGLVWQEPTPSSTYTWEEARCYCAGLTLAGREDWRLPTRIELISLIDETIPIPGTGVTPGPNINDAAFPSTVISFGAGQGVAGFGYWTSTPKAGSPSSAWNVHFDFLYGSDGYEDVAVRENVRCVRAPEGSQVQPSSHWTIQNGTVHDDFTGLTWQQSIPNEGGDDGVGDYTRDDASSYCAQLTLDGGGWRLPKVKELATLVDVTAAGPAIDSRAFPGTPGQGSGGAISDSFWTSTPTAGFTTDGLLVDFYDGAIGNDGAQYPYRVRCVR
jgi:hypothetical protein